MVGSLVEIETMAITSPPPPPAARGILSSPLVMFTMRGGSLLLAAFLIYKVIVMGGANMKEEWRHCYGSFLTLAFIGVGTGIVLSSYRWSRLLAVQGIFLSTWDALKLTMIGVFFNLAIPGGVGGDVVKMYKLTALAGSLYPQGIMTTLFDRILGLMGLFLVAILAVAFNWHFLMTTPDNDIRLTVSFVATVSVVGAVSVIIAMYHDLLYRVPLIRRVTLRAQSICPAKLWEVLGKVLGSISLFRVHLFEVLLALGISMIIHTLTALSIYAIGQAFQAPTLQMRDYFLATQIANTISAVPITPGGLGGRDYILLLFFHAFGEGPKSGVIPPVNSLMMIFWGLVGGVFFFTERQHIHVPLHVVPAAPPLKGP